MKKEKVEKAEGSKAKNQVKIATYVDDSKEVTKVISVMDEFGQEKNLENIKDELCFGCHSY